MAIVQVNVLDHGNRGRRTGVNRHIACRSNRRNYVFVGRSHQSINQFKPLVSSSPLITAGRSVFVRAFSMSLTRRIIVSTSYSGCTRGSVVSSNRAISACHLGGCPTGDRPRSTVCHSRYSQPGEPTNGIGTVQKPDPWCL
jgi:hypothetical protein